MECFASLPEFLRRAVCALRLRTAHVRSDPVRWKGNDPPSSLSDWIVACGWLHGLAVRSDDWFSHTATLNQSEAE